MAISSGLTAAGAIAAGCAVAGVAWAARGRSASVFGPSVWRAGKERRAIALTFDDGPVPATPKLLEILAEYRAPATFFQVGTHVLRNPDIAREVLAAGHAIGNHSHTHPLFALKSPAFIEDEFTRAQAAIEEVTGVRPSLLRAPYGVRWSGFRPMQKKIGLTGVMWTVIGRDWRLPAAEIADRVVTRATNGGIICLHDGRGIRPNPDVKPSLEAVRRIIPALLEAGYHFETVPQLLCPKN
jgi:peptidoglycan-N-acetylglucosamine deacetylase